MAADTIQLGSIPDYLRFRYDKSPQDMNGQQLQRDTARHRNEEVQLLKFPSTKNILWDHTDAGDAQVLHISYFRKPRLCVTEKVLRFAQRHVESSDQSSCNCVLVGSLNIDDDGEGVLFNVERLDPVGDTNSSTSHAAGDMLIPFTIQGGSKDRGSTAEDYSNALQLLKHRCCSKDPIELGNFLLTKGWCSFYSTGETSVHHLEFEVVTMGTEIKAQPIGPVPIVPTALSKNLSGPMSISHMQGTPKTGYLTMDHTRKLLLVLESDPKVTNLPLVGIWVSGVSYVYSPYVWACCLRYLYNSSIQDRVCSPPDPFLLVLYNPTHSKPEFYECSTASGSNKMMFDFYTGYEAVQISKNMMGKSEIVDVGLKLQRDGNKFELFQEAVLSSANDSGLDTSRRSMSPDPVSHDDITPRLKPAPHISKLPQMQSMVPEVSLFFGNDDTTAFVPSVQNPQTSQLQSRSQPPSRQYNSLPSSASVSTSKKHVSEAVSNYVQNAHGAKSTPSTVKDVNGLGSSELPASGISQNATQTFPSGGGPTSLQSFPASVPMYPHGINTAQSSQNVFSSAPVPHTVSMGQNGYIPAGAPPMGISHGYQNGYHPASGPPGMAAGLRPYCSCPSCPKPPQGYNRDMRGPMPHVRPVYPHYGPPPPRLNGQYTGHPQHQQGGYPPTQAPPYNSQPYPQFPERPPMSTAPYPVTQPPHPVPSQVNDYQPLQNPPLSSQISNRPYPQSSQALYDQSSKIRPPASQMQTPAPQTSLGLPVIAEGKASSPRTPVHSAEGTVSVSSSSEIQRSVPSSDSSGRSSDDSGLSFTPEKHHSPSNQNSKSPAAGDYTSALATINWEKIPPEIYQLLLQQDRQLKQLQAQIEMLTVQQSQSLNNTAESASMKPDPMHSPQEKCTTATNTSVGLGHSREQVSVSMQTSQQECENPQQKHDSSVRPCLPRQMSNKDVSHSSSNGSGYDARTPAEIRHRGRLPMNSTQREDADLDISQGELVALMNNMHDRTIDSVQSEMIVDLPSFQSSPTRSPRSQESCAESAAFNMSPRSPISASMCEQRPEDSESEYSDEEEDNTAGTDNPEYYNRLMDNIKKLLSQNTTENTTREMGDPGYSGDVSSDPSTPVRLAADDDRLGEQLQMFFKLEQNSMKAPVDTTFIPKINYVSMLLDSDTDTSMEINAMAMKYLKDEQLTQLTKLQAKNRLLQGTKKTSEKTALLQKILKMEDDSTPNVTTVGMSPNDLTFATKRYLERHGLLDGGSSSGHNTDSTQNDSYRLRTNYSTLTSGSEDGPAQITQEVLSTPQRYQAEAMASPANVNGIYSNGTTPTNNSSRTPNNDTKQSVGFNRTPKPNPVHSRLEDHRRLTPNTANSHNNSVPTSHTVSPFSHNSTPYSHEASRRDFGATGRYVTPQITRPPQRPTHSPPEKEIPQNQCSPQYFHQRNEVVDDNRQNNYKQGAVDVQQKQLFAVDRNNGVQNYYDARQHRPENADDDRILDITHLKQLPKLL